MRVYLAGRYTRKDELNRVRKWIEAAGHTVDCRWLDGSHEIASTRAGDGGDLAKAELVESQRLANEDWQDIRAADAVIVWTEKPRQTNSRGGRHVEFGIALGLGRPVVTIGPRENVFCYLEHVPNFEAWGPEVLEWLTKTEGELEEGSPGFKPQIPISEQERILKAMEPLTGLINSRREPESASDSP